ncbi:hypothetical protein PVAP13_8KG053700 [Panicum virgatum]|uniref:Uncharacterized protein n=1 Tax=Panicum virgatum TaxID=38727 RepID=A0A8T0PHC0_PANVG|nr:hypothetical protein PVAP13_8KG053700 [Panicum virgatum]
MSEEKHHHFFHQHKKDEEEQPAGGYSEAVAAGESEYERYKKEEKEHKHKQHLGEAGAIAAGAFALVQEAPPPLRLTRRQASSGPAAAHPPACSNNCGHDFAISPFRTLSLLACVRLRGGARASRCVPACTCLIFLCVRNCVE